MGGALHIGDGPQAVFTIDFKVIAPAPIVITLNGVEPHALRVDTPSADSLALGLL
jgi:hypothetical protein